MRFSPPTVSWLTATALSVLMLGSMANVQAVTPADLDRDIQQALHTLYKINPIAASLAKKSKAILVFPNVIKAGFVFGAAYGEGELVSGAKVDGYYNSVTGSWGLQAGAQSYAYAVFLMSDSAMKYVRDTHGWEIGVGPTVVVVDEGVAKNLSSSSLHGDAYAFIFSQQGLMAGVSIEGTKISHIKP